ncbi:nucleotidyltransferase family protein [Cohnella zeiphila]|uniref:Nucleotidyltransferase family protein n=1 Tax=Cohnella zeiphila TaxID=2761120 RepID=A0A7X0VY93_9BACL|nr:nucleotidyltransferase family protein [Cohnella zeiphila]MBB6735129.1 nucleotidyltransferase family protein [Cohnella zeiphila]
MDKSFRLDVGPFPMELNVMLEALRGGAGPEKERPGTPLLPNIDWNQFMKLVRHHRVYPQIYANPANGGLIPPDVLQTVGRDYRMNALGMLRLSAEMERVCKALNERGVRSLLLKGPALARLLYGDVSLRTSKDLDILIPVADVAKAESLLEELGFVADHPIPRGLGDWKWKLHHVAFTHPQTRIQVEVHWRLNGDLGKEPPFEELWNGRQQSELVEGLYMPGNEHLFMYLAMHGARHGWFRLRWLADIDRMARRSLDWEALVALLKRYHALDMAGQALVLASSLLHTPVPDALKPAAFSSRGQDLARRSQMFIRDADAWASLPGTGPAASAYKSYLFALKTTPQKWRFAISRLHPSFRDVEALPLPKPLYFLYFPLRPFVWLWRQVRQQQPLRDEEMG